MFLSVFKLFHVCINVTAANMVAQFSSKTKNCRCKADKTAETPGDNRIKLLASEDRLSGNMSSTPCASCVIAQY